MRKSRTLVVVAALLGLAACGDTFEEQALIGAGAGAATSVALDGNVAAGALVGAAGNVLYCDQNPGRC
ncbi:hypothetical protein [Oceanibium sediminis]|uniref:hypothetical protein n=1 Tax=Oceanibium sediminis TaxID=2026339 RepID=UPI000DD31745|nr:hypothetical protein [Oceanibium sediminis]